MIKSYLYLSKMLMMDTEEWKRESMSLSLVARNIMFYLYFYENISTVATMANEKQSNNSAFCHLRIPQLLGFP